jgi:tyrosine-protein kinase Etk/Wzc
MLILNSIITKSIFTVMNELKEKQARFSDYVYVLYKWKKFIIINLVTVTILSCVYALLLPLEYKATATFMIPPDTQTGFGGLTSLLGGKSSLAAVGSKIFGVTNTSEDVLLGIINSRSALTSVIKEFNLIEYYEIDDSNMDKVLKAFRNDISADPNEFGMIDFSVVNKDPKISAAIANYMVSLVDSLNIDFNIERARNNRIFIEQRYLQNVRDLKNAEDSLYKFQKKYGIVAVKEQLEISVKASAEIEAELFKKEVEAYIVEQNYGVNSIQYTSIKAEMELLKKKVQELKNSSELGSSSNILYPFKEMPDIAIEYLRAYREVTIQEYILEIVLPMYEQSKVEEQKSIPTVISIDHAIPPQLKYRPKRATIVLGLLFIYCLFLIPFVFMAEHSLSRTFHNNPIQEKFSNFSKKIKKLFRIKF